MQPQLQNVARSEFLGYLQWIDAHGGVGREGER
jgi:hypothetical protein